jgi:hypothetical protein
LFGNFKRLDEALYVKLKGQASIRRSATASTTFGLKGVKQIGWSNLQKGKKVQKEIIPAVLPQVLRPDTGFWTQVPP